MPDTPLSESPRDAIYKGYEAAGVPREGWAALYDAGMSVMDAQRYMQEWRELRHEGAVEYLYERAYGPRDA